MHDDANRTRRQLIGSAIGLVGAAGVARLVVAATSPPISGPAVAGAPAVRLGPPPVALPVPPPGKIAFPLDPSPSCYILDNFGDCRDGGTRGHAGVDLLDEKGRTVFSVVDGRLVQQYVLDGAAGNGWAVLGDDGVRYVYLHLDTFAPGLAVGSRVSFGDVIGTVGSTGTGSATNNHLHFEVRPVTASAPRGLPVDPLPLLDVPAGIPIGPPLKGCLGQT
jgi:murein DD-endopeptidase MepM/ murein hydrolase activator NlpD